MSLNFHRSFTTLIISCVFLLSAASIVSAQESAGITLIPAMIEEAANPGDSLNQVLKVSNESNVEKEYFLYKRNIKGVDAGGVPLFSEEGEDVTGFELADWIEIQAEPLKVPANATVELPVTIRIPEDASPGSHFGGIFISAEPPKLREIGAGVGYEVASVVSIRISGDVIDTARIRSFSTDKLLYSTKDVRFIAKIENQGNILIRPRGPLTITSIFGGKPEVITVNESLAGVFPRTMRDLAFSWNSEGFGFGKYEAVLALAYDGEDGQKTIDATAIFWVFPIKVMATGLAIVIGISVLGYALTRYYINQAIIRAAGGHRIVSPRYRRQVGVSRFTFVMTALLATLILFLLVILLFTV
jgi:hypothetical protein